MWFQKKKKKHKDNPIQQREERNRDSAEDLQDISVQNESCPAEMGLLLIRCMEDSNWGVGSFWREKGAFK